jgi:hypothetical protein
MHQKEPGAAGAEQASGGPNGSSSSAGGESKAGDQGPIIDAEVVDEKKKA